jgi:ABC-2 type transport system ATP-binding protein
MDNALEVRALRKSYKGFTLKDVTFDLPRGAILGLVGANGSGKTTIVKLILNLIRRDGGEIRVFGRDALADEKEVKARIGFVHETPAFIDAAPLRDLAAAAAPFYPRWDAGRFRALAGEFGLPLRKKFKALSHGMKMKFSLALALAHEAELLILDEPTSGLDPVFRRELLDRLAGLLQDEGRSVFFSTHITSDLERTADYVAVLHDGEIRLALSQDELRDRWAVVKGGEELLRPELGPLFQAVRRVPLGLEALTGDAPSARSACPPGTVVDRASLEDIMLFFDQGASHV